MTAKTAFLFPGQGSQCIGMGRDAAERLPAAAAVFDRANTVLGLDLRAVCFDGPEEELKKTETTQPALFAASMATLEVLRAEGIEPDAVAGHSLGEYTALCAAGCFDFETGLRLVALRGRAFAQAGAARPGAMAAIIGLDAGALEAVCAEASGGGAIVQPANYNDPTQIVISGDPVAVERACEGAKAAGAKRALPLPVSGAFHSPLVAPAADAMRDALAAADFAPPRVLFVNNADAATLSDPEAIKDSLVRQVTASVRWTQSIEALAAEGVGRFVEVGSGKVLSGLARRIAKGCEAHTTESGAALDAAIAALKG